MIYPINIKKKIKESRHLKENVRSVASVAAWLKDSIAAMTANQELTISKRILDSNFGFYVYWTQGFDINDDSIIHADADKSYGLVAALKCRNDAEWDGEYMDSPYDPKTGDLYCEDYELSPRDNTEMVAEWLLEDYNSMIDLINKNPEIVIGGLKESKSVKESYDPEDCYTVWEVRDNSTGEIKRIHSYDKDPEDFSTWLDDDEIINQYADEDMVITRFVYDNGLLDTSEVIWPEDLDESKSIKESPEVTDWNSTDSLSADMEDKRVAYSVVVFPEEGKHGKHTKVFDDIEEAKDFADSVYPNAYSVVIRREEARGRFSGPAVIRRNGLWNDARKVNEASDTTKAKESSDDIFANNMEEFCNKLDLEYKWGAGIFYPKWDAYNEFRNKLDAAGLKDTTFWYFQGSNPDKGRGNPDADICVSAEDEDSYAMVEVYKFPIYKKSTKSINEAPDADGILYDYEVGAKYNDMANAEMKQNAEYRKQIAEYKSQISKLVPEIKEMLDKIRSANKTYLTVNAGRVSRGTFEIEGDFNIDSKYKVNNIPEGSSYLTIKHNDSGECASRYSASVTDSGEIYTWADTGSWTDFNLRDKGYATSKALKFFLDNFDAVKARFKIDLAPKEYIYKYDGKFLDNKLAEQGYNPENEEDDDYIWDYKRDRQFVNNKTVKLISDKPDEDGMVDIEYGYNQKLTVYFSELTPINESKSIKKEGFTTREILDQAKALLEK